MDTNDLLNAGRDIMNDISRAVSDNDFSHLERDINAQMNRVLNTGWNTRQNRNYGQGNRGPAVNRGPYGNRGPAASWGPAQQGAFQNGANPYLNRRQMPRVQNNFCVRNLSRGTGTGQMVAGLLGIFANASFLLGAMVMFAFDTLAGLGMTLVLIGLIVAFAMLYRSGSKKKKLVSLYYDYGRRLGNAEYFDIRDFARYLGISPETLTRQIRDMMNAGFLPYARFDAAGTTLILTDHAYKLYLQSKQSWESRQRAENQNTASQQASQNGGAGTAGGMQGEPAEDASLSPEVREVVEKGRTYIRHIRAVNDEIPDTEEMSNKLYRLEDITNRIFERMKTHPESVPSMKKFMEYYLPTTQKLMDAYVELYRQPDAGTNIRDTKQEIERSIDLVNSAYEKLLDEMFEDTAWDVSSDINVMKTMMEQDGLSDEGKIRKDS